MAATDHPSPTSSPSSPKRSGPPRPDDQLLGFTGPEAEAEEIKTQLARFLRDDLALELSPEKTLITHARTRAARFLGYDIITQTASRRITNGRRATNATIGLRVHKDVIKAKIVPYLRRGKPAHRSELINESDHTIVATYGAIYMGSSGTTCPPVTSTDSTGSNGS